MKKLLLSLLLLTCSTITFNMDGYTPSDDDEQLIPQHNPFELGLPSGRNIGYASREIVGDATMRYDASMRPEASSGSRSNSSSTTPTRRRSPQKPSHLTEKEFLRRQKTATMASYGAAQGRSPEEVPLIQTEGMLDTPQPTGNTTRSPLTRTSTAPFIPELRDDDVDTLMPRVATLAPVAPPAQRGTHLTVPATSAEPANLTRIARERNLAALRNLQYGAPQSGSTTDPAPAIVYTDRQRALLQEATARGTSPQRRAGIIAEPLSPREVRLAKSMEAAAHDAMQGQVVRHEHATVVHAISNRSSGLTARRVSPPKTGANTHRAPSLRPGNQTPSRKL